MRRWVIGTILVLCLGYVTGVFAEHVYINGRISSFSGGSISINTGYATQSYRVDTNARVVRHVMINGAVMEEIASMTDISVGKIATVKVEGGMVKEIILEEYHGR